MWWTGICNFSKHILWRDERINAGIFDVFEIYINKYVRYVRLHRDKFIIIAQNCMPRNGIEIKFLYVNFEKQFPDSSSQYFLLYCHSLILFTNLNVHPVYVFVKNSAFIVLKFDSCKVRACKRVKITETKYSLVYIMRILNIFMPTSYCIVVTFFQDMFSLSGNLSNDRIRKLREKYK